MNQGNLLEDRRAMFALILCFMILVAYTDYQGKRQAAEQQAAQPVQQQQVIPQPQGQAPTSPVQATSPTYTGAPTNALPPTEAQIDEAGFVVVSSPLYQATISLLGGRFKSFQLKDYKATLRGSEYLEAIYWSWPSQMPLGVGLGNANDDFVHYTVEPALPPSGTIEVPAGQEISLFMTGTIPEGQLGAGQVFRKRLTFRGGSYLIHAGVEAVGSQAPVSLDWTTTLPPASKQTRYDHPILTVLNGSDKVEHPTPTESLEETPAHWIAIGDRYFMGAIISDNAVASAKSRVYSVTGGEGEPVEAIETELQSRQAGEASFELFVGPKHYSLLQRVGFKLERAVDFGFFSFLSLPLLMTMNFFYSIIGNYGLAIVLLTLAIKLLFLPLTSVSFRSMKAMQEIQPEIKALRERIKDPTELNQEMMGLYKKRGVNPMGGCLPMFIQIPVFFGLYSALLHATELRHAPFALWVTDLSAPEALHIFGLPVPILILIMGVSMFLQQHLNPSAMDPQQKRIFMFMPVMFTVMFVIFPFPSGLVLYWLTSNLISIVQQIYLRSEKHASALGATVLASAVIFALAWIVTEFPLMYQA